MIPVNVPSMTTPTIGRHSHQAHNNLLACQCHAGQSQPVHATVTTVYALTSETSHARRSTISERSPALLIVRARPCRTDVTHVIAATATRHVTCSPKRSSSLGLDFARHATPPSHLFSYRRHRSISFPLNILLPSSPRRRPPIPASKSKRIAQLLVG